MIRIAALVIAIAVATAAAPQPAAHTSLSSARPRAENSATHAMASRPAEPASAPAAPARAQPLPPALKREATVSGEIVRIGDLLDNADAVAQVPIFRAPDLGQSGSVPVARVIEALRPHHVVSLDIRGLDEVKVKRASRLVTVKEIETRVLRALAGQAGMPDGKDFTIGIDNEIPALHVEPNAELRVTRAVYDQRARRFEVTFDLPSNSARQASLRVTGALAETAEA